MTEPVTYSLDKTIPLPDVQRLLAQTRWAKNRSLDSLQIMLKNSVCVGAWCDDTLIGFARAITDDVYRAYIEDVVVDEAWRRQGVGRALVDVLLERLDHVEEVNLVCEDHLVDYYICVGFTRNPLNAMNIWKGGEYPL